LSSEIRVLDVVLGVFVIVFSLHVVLRPLMSSALRRAVRRSDGPERRRADDFVGRCVAVQLWAGHSIYLHTLKDSSKTECTVDRTQSVWINWDAMPSGYAEDPDNWIFLWT